MANATQPFQVIYAIGVDQQSQQTVTELAENLNAKVQFCDTIAEMMATHDWSRPTCIVTTICQLVMDSPMKDVLAAERDTCPVIVLSGHQTRVAFEALAKNGVRWLKKPLDESQFREAVRRAMEADEDHRALHLQELDVRKRLNNLTQDEQRVLQLMLAGKLNKEIASIMDVSKRTVESRRRSISKKMGADSLAELVLKVARAGDSAMSPNEATEA